MPTITQEKVVSLPGPLGPRLLPLPLLLLLCRSVSGTP